MTGVDQNKDRAVIVYGAGISGRGAAEVLARRGQRVYLYNDSPCALDEQLLAALRAVGGDLIIGGDAYAKALAEAGMVVLSPGPHISDIPKEL